MWCVMHVGSGNEDRMEELAAVLLQNLAVRCFHLTRNRKKKYGGRWQTIQETLFPEYMFIDTEQPEAVYQKLKKVQGLRFLSSDDTYVATLDAGETAFMEQLADFGGVIEISRIRVAENGKIQYLTGPLVHIPDKVRKVDLHRRVAEIETAFMGRNLPLYVGIEIDSQGQ